MKFHSWPLALFVMIALVGFTLPGYAKDFGEASDVGQVRKIVATKFGHALHASVSHDWALCTAYSDESDISVVLHRTNAGWKVAGHDGGAYDAETLQSLGVPRSDIAPLLKAYQ
jgi:hypothetical protein